MIWRKGQREKRMRREKIIKKKARTRMKTKRRRRGRSGR